jgi:hypothetical protein
MKRKLPRHPWPYWPSSPQLLWHSHESEPIKFHHLLPRNAEKEKLSAAKTETALSFELSTKDVAIRGVSSRIAARFMVAFPAVDKPLITNKILFSVGLNIPLTRLLSSSAICDHL